MNNNIVFVTSVATAALAGLLFGFDTAVISGVTSDLRDLFALSASELGITVSIALWGTLIGALGAGWLGDRYGSRDALQLMAGFYLISGVGCALSWDWLSLVVFRFIGGLAIGGSSVLAPVYIAEIAPPRRRGALVGLFQINIVVGILVAYLSNYLVGQLNLGPHEWRWKLAVTAAPAAFLFFMLIGIPKSPRWLALRGRIAEARLALIRMGVADVQTDLAEIQAIRTDTSATDASRSLKKPIFLAVAIAMFNQLSGINAILYYLNDIFASAGFAKVSSDLQAIAIGATNLLFTIVAMAFIDRLGRKRLLLIGAVGTALCLASVAYIFAHSTGQQFLIWMLIGFIAFFAFSQGAVIWVYISEIFPTTFRSRGQSIGSGTHWFMCALISLSFPAIAARSHAAPFWFFAAMMALQFAVVLLYFPETKGVTLEKMAETMH
jgi:MFS transporter, SP family, arabinose:H+ symporter